MIVFDRSNFANPLVTGEDYEKACEEFVIPYCRQQAELINAEMSAMTTLIGDKTNDELDAIQNEMDVIQGRVQQAASFSDPKTGGEIYIFMEEVVALENKLQEQGAFNEESS